MRNEMPTYPYPNPLPFALESSLSAEERRWRGNEGEAKRAVAKPQGIGIRNGKNQK